MRINRDSWLYRVAFLLNIIFWSEGRYRVHLDRLQAGGLEVSRPPYDEVRRLDLWLRLIWMPVMSLLFFAWVGITILTLAGLGIVLLGVEMLWRFVQRVVLKRAVTTTWWQKVARYASRPITIE